MIGDGEGGGGEGTAALKGGMPVLPPHTGGPPIRSSRGGALPRGAPAPPLPSGGVPAIRAWERGARGGGTETPVLHPGPSTRVSPAPTPQTHHTPKGPPGAVCFLCGQISYWWLCNHCQPAAGRTGGPPVVASLGPTQRSPSTPDVAPQAVRGKGDVWVTAACGRPRPISHRGYVGALAAATAGAGESDARSLLILWGPGGQGDLGVQPRIKSDCHGRPTPAYSNETTLPH